MLGLHTTTAARLYADPAAKTTASVSNYDKTASFTLAAALCLLTGIIITPIVYKLYHWFNSKIMNEQALPFAKKTMHATIENMGSGYRELKVGEKVYCETMMQGEPVITVKDIRTNKTLKLEDDLVAQVRDMTQESDQKDSQDETMGSEKERSLWWEAADWVSMLLGLNPDVQIKGNMFLDEIKSRAEVMVRAAAAANAKEEVLVMLGDTSRPKADIKKKELAEIHCICADFKATLCSDDTFGTDERLDSCINYLNKNPENLGVLKSMFSAVGSDEKLKNYLDSCSVTGKNAYENDNDERGLFFTNLGSAVNTLHSTMTYISAQEKLPQLL